MDVLELEIAPNNSCSYDDDDDIDASAHGRGDTRRLLGKSSSNYSSLIRREDCRWFLISVLVILSMSMFYFKPELGAARTADKTLRSTDMIDDSILSYPCPTNFSKATKGRDKLKKWYDTVSQQILAGNMTEYLKVFRHSEFDNWGHTYDEIKQGMYEWKRTHYSELSDNSSIYESACGIGLNLFMTLEILAETQNVQGVVVYGNEYVDESVQIFRQLATQMPWPGNARPGTICTGDSTSLCFVPSDSFDLVFTGYITPQMDPLQLGKSTDNNYARLTELCESSPDDHESQKLLKSAVQRQEDWYASWVSEMVRIAKPGAPVIVEQVSYPFCEAYFDWDGVSQDFWKRAISKYNWNVDPDSIVMDDDKIFRRRYHVFMRKNS